MIALRLVLAPESSKKVNFEDSATLKELQETVRKSFGLSSCSLIQFGYPSPKTLTITKTNESDKILSAGIQNQDRIQVILPAGEEKKKAASACTGTSQLSFIPGLTKEHYIKNSAKSSDTPKLVSSSQRLPTSTQSSFHLNWTAEGSRGESYALSAKGDIVGKEELVVHCECVAFSKRGENQTNGKLRVCKHLQAALDSVVDSTAKFDQNNKKKKNVVDLLSESSDDDAHVEETGDRKRPAASASMAPKTKKRRSNSTTTPTIEAPIRLFATQLDRALRRHAPRSHHCFTHCKTLPEMVFGSNHGNKNTAVQWMVVSNFLIEFNYLLEELPQLLTIPRLVVFHSDKQPNPTTWPTNNNNEVDFIQLNPGADPGTRSNPTKYRFEYGSHHTKLFLVGYKDRIRVVVSTSNLRAGDAVKANAAYVEEFPLKQDCDKATTTSEFEESLAHYIRSYNYWKKRNWMGCGPQQGQQQRETLMETLQRYDYSQAKAILIPSIPGYHNIDNKTPWLGQLKLRQAIQQYTTPTKTPRPVVCQFSSIGSTSEAYLHSLQTSMDTCLAQDGSKGSSLQLKLVYPTVEEIRSSVEGYVGGDSVPGRNNNVSKPFLKPMWHKWSSTQEESNPLMKPKNVPHIKSYYQTNGNNGLDWLVITSHNISQAAWGTIRKNKKYGGQHLYIRSWELGVFVSPQTMGVKKLVPFEGKRASAGTANVAMPYATHALEPYAPNHRPWACDLIYQHPDANGYHSCMGHTSSNPDSL